VGEEKEAKEADEELGRRNVLWYACVASEGPGTSRDEATVVLLISGLRISSLSASSVGTSS